MRSFHLIYDYVKILFAIKHDNNYSLYYSMNELTLFRRQAVSEYKKFYVAYLDVQESFGVRQFDTVEEAREFVKTEPLNEAQILEGRLVKTPRHND